MADIELVIKIPEEDYINIKNAINSLIEHGVERDSMSQVCLAILDGKPLPKWHGRLIDGDRAANKLEAIMDGLNCYGNAYESGIYKGYDNSLDEVVDEPTIIEAYKEGEE